LMGLIKLVVLMAYVYQRLMEYDVNGCPVLQLLFPYDNIIFIYDCYKITMKT